MESLLNKDTGRLSRRIRGAAGGLAVRRDYAYWKQLKGKCIGKRGWVIGNGPSLKIDDLDRLKNEVCIASNKIHLAFEQTTWRPSLITVVDKVLWPKIRKSGEEHYEKIHFPRSLCSFRDLLNRKYKYWNALPNADTDPDTELRFSDDVAKGVHGGYSVTFDNLQIAVHLGLNPIYIIGCDHFYAGECPDDVSKKTIEVKELNHFHPDYRKKGEVVTPANIEGIDLAYRHARSYGKSNGIEIYNATRGGHLEVFERRDFDRVLAASG